MARCREQLFGGRYLNDPAEVHDRHPVAQVPDDGQVVRDEQQRQAQLGAQVLQQVQDGGLDADVQGRDRLVRDQQFGPQRQRPGDRDELPLAAGELPGIGVHRLLVEADQAKQFPRVGGYLRAGHDVMHAQQLVQHAADCHPGVQRGVRVLEDHLYLALVGPGPAGGQNLAQAGERPRQRGLAGAGLADQRDRLAALDPQVDSVHGVQHARLVPDPRGQRRADRETDRQAGGAEQRRAISRRL